MTETTIDMQAPRETSEIRQIVETYRGWVETLAGYMGRAAGLLDGLYEEQDEVIDQLRKLCAKTHSLRHADFDAIFGKMLADRDRTRESLSAMVSGYRFGREMVIKEVREMFSSDMARAVEVWPALKQRLLGEKDDGVGEIVAVLRQVHMEQEKIATALSGLLMRGERLKIDDLTTVAQEAHRQGFAGVRGTGGIAGYMRIGWT